MADQYSPQVQLNQNKPLTISDVWQQPTPERMMEMAMMPQRMLAGRIQITNALAQAGMNPEQINKALGSQADPGMTQGAVETEQLARQTAITQQKQKFLEPFVKSLIETGDNEGLMKLMSVYETDPHLGPMTKQLRDAGLTITGKGETEMIAPMDKPKLEAISQKASTPELADAIKAAPPGDYKIKQKGGKITQFEPHEGKGLSTEQLVAKSLEEKLGRKPSATEITIQLQQDKLAQARAQRAIIVNNPVGGRGGQGDTPFASMPEPEKENAYKNFILNKVMPSFGMGKNPDRAAWNAGLNKYMVANKITPEDVATGRAAIKFQQSTGTLQNKAILTTIDPLLDELLKTGKALGNTQIPGWNYLVNTFKEAAGQPEIVAFKNLRDDTIAEVERGLLNTGVLSDTKYIRAANNVRNSQSFPQLQAAVKNMRIVIRARLGAIGTMSIPPSNLQSGGGESSSNKTMTWADLKKQRGW